ncbi:fibropellin-1 [Strongylocentrotus purpuratus]|uniref:receptor protein-tyrosine kinase n=1 Tax=Strongylocentrotus purpuratus TaxID=7668 RepID=A0A7M7NA33_STRPU|nr:fibropellin-1 [Strongylocentrotus purpuratus]
MTPSRTLRIFLVSVTVSLMFISINGMDCVNNSDCENEGTCDANGKCDCTTSYTGPNCGSPTSCVFNECVNGATCVPSGMEYTCTCRPAHKGIFCEFLLNYTSCDLDPCQNGVCVDDLDGNVYCDCTPFTEGAFCERTPNCDNKNPCRNGGTCMNGATVDDPSSCVCGSAWRGDICQLPTTCDSSPCQNGGTCIPSEGSVTCDCAAMWEGPTCEANSSCFECASEYDCVIDEWVCDGDKDCNNGEDELYCTTNYNSSCFECASEYECVNDPSWVCDGDNDCNNGEDELYCTTPITTCSTGGCFNGGTCANGICQCTEFYTGEFCEDDINNMCGSDFCLNGGICIEGTTAYCNCREGFSGDFCEIDINNMCGSDVCLNGGICIEGTTAYCNCREGFSGQFCEIDIRMCSSGVCLNDGTCIDSGTTAYCLCSQDFTGEFCETESACFDRPCRNGGSCVSIPSSSTSAPTSTPGSYYCECPSGYSGENCTMITPCIPSPCLNSGVCTPQNGMPSYTCDCASGFTGRECENTQNPPMNNALSQTTIGIIAGSVAAVVIVVIIIIAIACCCCRKKRDDDKDGLTGLEMGANQRGRHHDYVPSPTKTLMPAIPNLRISTMRDATKMEFPRNRLTLFNKLGSGSFADVYKAEAVGIITKEEKTIVAVKRLKETATENDKSDLSKELSLYMYLDPHPNIVNILGCCTDSGKIHCICFVRVELLWSSMNILPLCLVSVDPWYIIMEYLPNNNLQGYLRQIRTGESMTADYRNVKKQKDIPPNDLLTFGVQIARGMEYLASRQCIHRDLAARNILLGEGYVCKVSDFGLARDLEDGQTYEMKSQGRVPVRWMSPESLLHNTYTSQSDVWSFAILIWEIVTLGSHPYPGMSSKQVVKEISAGYRLPKPEHCSQDIYNLMKECWAYEAEERPTFSQVKVRLENMLADAQGYLVMSDFNDDNYLYLEPDAHTGDELDNEGFSHLE